jgi:type IV pilus assembly protein PilY1
MLVVEDGGEPAIRRYWDLAYQPKHEGSDESLTTCSAGATALTYPAPVRFCLTEADANRADTPTGNDRFGVLPRCQKKYREFATAVSGTGYSYAGFLYPRYGQFRRTTISGGTYPRGTLRSDCISSPSSCSSTEELQNFANWFAYYRYRMLMMKTSGGLAFSPIDSRYRVGFITINFDSGEYLKINDFGTSHKSSWYTMFYAQNPGGGTPLPTALSRVGRHFAGKTDGVNSAWGTIRPVLVPAELRTADHRRVLAGGAAKPVRCVPAPPRRPSAIGTTFACSAPIEKSVCRPVYDSYASTSTNGEFSTSGTLADVAVLLQQRPPHEAVDVGRQRAGRRKRQGQLAARDHLGLGMAGSDELAEGHDSADSGGLQDQERPDRSCSWDSQCRWPIPAWAGRRTWTIWHAAVNGRREVLLRPRHAGGLAGLQDGS